MQWGPRPAHVIALPLRRMKRLFAATFLGRSPSHPAWRALWAGTPASSRWQRVVLASERLAGNRWVPLSVVAASLAVVQWLGSESSADVGPHVARATDGGAALIALLSVVFGSALAWMLLGMRQRQLGRLHASLRVTGFRGPAALAAPARAGGLLRIVVASAALTALYVLLPIFAAGDASTGGDSALAIRFMPWPWVTLGLVLFTANIWAFGAFLLETFETNEVLLLAIREVRPIYGRHDALLVEIAWFHWLSSAATFLWVLFAGWLIAAFAWAETGDLLPATGASVVLNASVLVVATVIGWTFFGRPLLAQRSALGANRERLRAPFTRALASQLTTSSSGLASVAPGIESTLRLIDQATPAWPLPIDQVRALLVTAVLPTALLAVNLLRVLGQIAASG